MVERKAFVGATSKTNKTGNKRQSIASSSSLVALDCECECDNKTESHEFVRQPVDEDEVEGRADGLWRISHCFPVAERKIAYLTRANHCDVCVT